MTTPVLILPGISNSGPQHWQTLWENRFPNFKRVQQSEWEAPECADWIANLDQAIAACAEPPVLVGHSAACTLIGKWAEQHQRPVKGALLVAPSDTEAASYPVEPTGFQPMSTAKLPFPSIVVASSNDEYVTIERARQFSSNWGSDLVEIGAYGHINGNSGLGEWAQGLALLKHLTD
ncbi:alpha/beta hydrolase [Silvimonas sp.]|uniref:RBBP9/YdeN family alpha/beta hydrolase n=1 Tax=Silvimonas sp. TaxID=2650811 RepID=UPI00284D056F|nr:alpha/beta hydrolase [Silvimonas sp.]MDR3426737.1 alpha/beta hydrolase [Silvimonas sp.]